jgi:hypothetical protein
VRQIVIPFRADLARDCRREGDLTADASRGSNRYLDRTPGSRWDRVRHEAEEACLARPLNAEELAHQARQRQETEAREVRERKARAE